MHVSRSGEEISAQDQRQILHSLPQKINKNTRQTEQNKQQQEQQPVWERQTSVTQLVEPR